MEEMPQVLATFIATYGLKVIGAILILLLGRVAAGLGRKIVRRLLERSQVDLSVVGFLSSLTYAVIVVFAVVAALSKFGVETTSFVAVLGAAGFAIGLAFQGSLSNFAAGVLLLVFRPFKVGDFIEGAGVSGTVKRIDLFTTILATPENIQVIIPNSTISSDVIKNFTTNDTRRVDLEIGIGYKSSMEEALKILSELADADSRILKDPAPIAVVSTFGDSGVNLLLRAWVPRAELLEIKSDFQKLVKERFDAAGIEIPFLQRVIHQVS